MMSSERAGTHTSGALNREKAREVLDRERQPYDGDVDDLITELEACVVPDPRLARIEALLNEWEGRGLGPYFLESLREILRGDACAIGH